MQSGHQHFSSVIGTIYDSAIDPAMWPDALAGMCGLLRACFGSITIANPVTSSFRFVARWGGDPYWIDLLDRKYANMMPFLPVLDQFEPGEPFNMSMAAALLNDDSVWDGPFVKEWATPAGIGDSASAILLRSHHRLATIGLGTSIEEGVVSAEKLELLGLLVPHVRRALSIGDLIDMKQLAADTFERMLDAVPVGVVAVDSRCRVVHANQVGDGMLAAGDPLAVRGGKVIVPGSTTTTLMLQEAVARASDREATMVGDGGGVPLRFGDGRPAVGHVLPLRHRVAHEGLATGAGAAIFVATPTDAAPAPVSALVALYGLSEAESRVLVQICEGLNRGQAAAALKVADSTVKTHLNRIFAKTGTSTQSELVRLVVSLSAPTSNDYGRG